MTEDQKKALTNVEAMLGEVCGGLKVASDRAERSIPCDTALCDMLRGLHRIADLAGQEWDIASGASTRG